MSQEWMCYNCGAYATGEEPPLECWECGRSEVKWLPVCNGCGCARHKSNILETDEGMYCLINKSCARVTG